MTLCENHSWNIDKDQNVSLEVQTYYTNNLNSSWCTSSDCRLYRTQAFWRKFQDKRTNQNSSLLLRSKLRSKKKTMSQYSSQILKVPFIEDLFMLKRSSIGCSRSSRSRTTGRKTYFLAYIEKWSNKKDKKKQKLFDEIISGKKYLNGSCNRLSTYGWVLPRSRRKFATFLMIA